MIENEKSIKIICRYAANGTVAKPMIVFPYKCIPKELGLSVPKIRHCERSDSGGWMENYIFQRIEKSLITNNCKMCLRVLDSQAQNKTLNTFSQLCNIKACNSQGEHNIQE